MLREQNCRRALGLIAGLAVASASPALSKDNFSVTVRVGGTEGTTATATLDDFVDLAFQSEGLSDVNAAYTDISPASVFLDFRGLDINIEYPDSGPALILDIPDLDVRETFDASLVREDNEDALEDYLESDEDGTLSRILEYLVSETATDPVAGNPASLQGQMIAHSFALGTGLGAGNSFDTPGDRDAGAGDQGRRSVYGLGARLGRYQVDGNDITTVELPFTFVRPLSDPRYAIVIDVPLTYSDTNDAESISAALGVGMRVPITTRWNLTPSVRAGVAGSVDLGSLATMYAANIASQYRFGWGGTEVTIGNMLSYISTAGDSQSVDDYEINYDLQNTVSRNGIGFSGPLDYKLFGLPTTWEFDIVNTQIFGDDVYIDNYTDIALSVGSKASRNGLTWDSVRFGLTYTVGAKDFDALKVNFGYQF